MIEKPALSNKHVIECLYSKYNIVVTSLIPLAIGADIEASIYRVKAGELSYFVKLRQGHDKDISTTILPFLQASGIKHVISPIKTLEGELGQNIHDSTLSLYPYIEGQNGFSRNLTDDQWILLGKVLKQIHELDVPSTIKDQVREETYSPKWREIVRSLDVYGNLKGDEVTLKLQTFIKEHKETIHLLVNLAEFLSQQIQKQPVKHVLCHSDIHAGNVLIAKNDIIYIVDWDEPIMAPKERDLMFIGGGVCNTWNNTRDEELFYKGYGKVHINMEMLAYYRLERIVEDIAIVSQQLLLTTAGGENRLELYKQFVSMFEPNDVIDIAFKTYEKLAL